MAEIKNEAVNALNTARSVSTNRLDGVCDRTKLDLVRVNKNIELGLRDVTTYARRALTDAKTTSTALFREIAGQGPDKTLGRGFAIVRNVDGRPLSSQSGIKAGETLDIEFRDGHVATQVT
jgi:exodeoxyribonuclease VII large subunit